MLRQGIEWKLTSPGEKTEEGIVSLFVFFGDVTRNMRWDTLDFMDGDMIGSKIARICPNF